ncbi:alpha/beta fold hydrolase [Aeromicrobium piscarium]|uniref:Alpha/beta fold hydrolase n=1 Tax=Aeromicrobium piscarium TaxID=2590901 RepID=A0A554RMP2_9ACTN|nr:alpha/beta fold hydrolase [Aeromicrobium piscarium]TSD55282.1 alpha/beta fold hydrolase [Aeromicrobium piscarium]
MSPIRHQNAILSSSDVRSVVAADSAHISYEFAEHTVGPNLVLLHSLGADRHMWAGVCEALEDEFQLIIPDLRGHGASEGGLANTIDQWPSDLSAVVDDAVGTEPVFIVGVSLGGIHAMAFGASNSSRVAGMVIADSFAELPEAVATEKISALQSQTRSSTMDAVADRYLADTFERPYPAGADSVRRSLAALESEVYRRAVASCFSVKLTPQLSTIDAPTLVLWGDRDSKTPRHLSERIVDGIDGASLGIVPDAGHLSNIDNPQSFALAVKRFVHGCVLSADAGELKNFKGEC